MRVDRVGAETMLAGIVALVARAQAQRPKLAHAGERAARSFVARVLALTVLTGAVWSVFDPSRAFSAAWLCWSCRVRARLHWPFPRPSLVRSRSWRVAVSWSSSRMRFRRWPRRRMSCSTRLARSPNLELALADVATFGGVSREAALSLAASLGRESRHPVARAIAAAHGGVRSRPASDVTSHAGLGISGMVGHANSALVTARSLSASTLSVRPKTPFCSPTPPVRSLHFD